MSGIPIYSASPITSAPTPGLMPQNPRTTSLSSQLSSISPKTLPKAHAPTATQETSTSTAALPPTTTTAVTTSSYNPTTTTTPTPSYSSYPQAQPGTPSVPQPTSTASTTYTPQAYAPTASLPPLQTRTSSASPPLPQPGAFPTPGHRRKPSNIPPPPKAGEKVQPASYYAPTPTQSVLPAPLAYASGNNGSGGNGYHAGLQHNAQAFRENERGTPISRLTSVATGPASAAMVRLGSHGSSSEGGSYGGGGGGGGGGYNAADDSSLAHPPGYVQNPAAPQHVPQHYHPHAPPTPSASYPFGNNGGGGVLGGETTGGIVGQGQGGGILGNGGGGLRGGEGYGGGERGLDGRSYGDEEGEGVWGWVRGVGKTLERVEGEVWRRVNGD